MKYSASIKSYDPDDEGSEEFDTWDEAAEWLADQRKYHRGSGNMQVNGQGVRFGDDGVLVYNNPSPVVRQAAPTGDVLQSLPRSHSDFDRIFRPKSARPTNVATLDATGKLGAGE